MKKISFLLIIFIFIIGGCKEKPSNDKETHTHTFETEWKYDDNNHYHEATCGHNIKDNEELHNLETTIIKEATHFEKGMKMYSCKICDYTRNEDIEIINHTFSETYAFDEAYHYYECQCGEKKDVENHDYGEGEIVVEESNLTNGLKIYKCKCGSTKEEVIPATGFITDERKEEIYLITTSAGVNISNSVGISWHCKNSGSYLIYKKENTDEFIEEKPKEEYWSIEESYMSDPYQNKRYVCTVDLKDLEENTNYIYKIVSDDIASCDMSFKTADSKTSFYSFLSFVDFQYSENATTLKLVNKFIKENPKANLITCSGDITDEGYSEKSHRYLFDSDVFKNSILAFGAGDHEYWGSDKSPIKMFARPYSFNKLFNNPKNGCDGYINTSYYFRYNTTLFAFLDCGDSNVSSSNEMFIKQAEWLDNILSIEKDYDFIIICMHKSLYGDPKQDSSVRKFAPVFTKVFDKHKVDLVISGHDHEYSRTKALYNGTSNKFGTVYLDLGNSGNKTRATGEDVKTSSLYDKYIDIKESNLSLGIIGTVNKNMLSVVVRDKDYNMIDSVEIIKKNR